MLNRMRDALHGMSPSQLGVFLSGIVLALFLIYTSATQPLQPTLQRGVFLLIVIICAAIANRSRRSLLWLDAGLVASGVAAVGYLLVNWRSLAYTFSFHASTLEIVLGFALFIAVLEYTRRVVGWPLSVVAIVAILYARFGYLLPGVFTHRGYDLSRLVTNQYLTHEGLFGSILALAATLIGMFVLFGCIIQKTGLAELFLDVSLKVAGHVRGGPAQMAVIGSSLFGTMSGSSTSNVLATGTTTIPLMKRAGYEPHFAGGVETAASTGGQIMPPIMGAGAFLMAYVTGIPYVTILIAAVIPACLYYAALFIAVELEARRLGIRPLAEMQQSVPTKNILLRLYLLTSFGVLLYLLLIMFSPQKAALWATVTALIVSLPRTDTRINWDKLKELIPMFVGAVVTVGLACATAGIVVGVINLTGAGLRLTYAFVYVAGDNQLLLMVLVMILSLLLGMGLPTVAAYAVVASFAAPALMEFGIDRLFAHFFVFYYACMSSVTPPVAIPAYAAAGVAGARPMKTALTAFGLALSGLVLPFLFVYRPGFLLGTGASPMATLECIAIGVFLVFLLSIAVVGFFLRPVPLYQRLLLGVAALLLVIPAAGTNAVAVLLAAGAFVAHIMGVRSAK